MLVINTSTGQENADTLLNTDITKSPIIGTIGDKFKQLLTLKKFIGLK